MTKRLPEVTDEKGQRIQLGPVLGQGGEGAVFEVASVAGAVAKIYHQPLSPDRADKIRIMAALRNDQIASLTAWPAGLLLAKGNNAPIGLLMPKVAGRKDIHNLYSPKSRRAEFQRADWRFLIRASANTARAFGAVHAAGCVIGDVNHGGVLVGQDATVRLIDCDSFQVMSGSRRFLCEVGVETFTPPELQGKPFKGVVRTESHDNFGLAVMTFLMLFMGRHPFAGRYLGAGDMPIPKAIEEFRFPYGAKRALFQMERPPGTPPLSIVGSELEALFERAFAREAVQQGRPPAREWAAALDRLEKNLKQCAANPSHWHHSGSSCPWCPMEGATGVPLFPMVVQTAAGSLFDINELWRHVEAMAHPGPVPTLAAPQVTASAQARSVGQANSFRNISATAVGGLLIAASIFGGTRAPYPVMLFALGVIAFFGILKALDKSTEVQGYKANLEAATKRWKQAEAEWLEKAGSLAFDVKKGWLLGLRQSWNNIPNVRLRKLEELRRNQHRLQLERFLDSFQIEKAKIEGVGSGRKQTLESYGIETAADIERHKLRGIPGFGPKLQSALLNWRAGLERRFIFDPSRAIDPRDIAKVEQEVLTEKTNLERQLRGGVAELKQVHAQIQGVRQHMRGPVEAAYRAYLQAVADNAAVS